jgi:hypothetical protein
MIESENVLLLERIARRKGMRLFWQVVDGRVEVCTYRERFVRPVFTGSGKGMAEQLDRAAAVAIGYWGQRGTDGLLADWSEG